MPAAKEDRFSAVYPEDYKGKLRWMVRHPDHNAKVRVAAPTEQAAVVAAAIAWRCDWTPISFYAYCDVEEDR